MCISTAEKLGPPHDFKARHQSPHLVHLSWSHPDRELPQLQQDNFLYFLSCWSQNNNFQLSANGSSIDLQDLQPLTEYTCLLSTEPSLSENETAMITFTTLGKE